MNSIYDFTLKGIDGNDVPLSRFSGSVLLIVNVASKCGFTKQYAGLEDLHRKFSDRGFTVLGFPANDFLGQEPGSDAEIKSFCSLTYGVTFPMFAKISVKGKTIHPLYRFLTGDERHKEYNGPITWNFNKFLIGKDGSVIGRFDSKVEPLSETITNAIESALA